MRIISKVCCALAVIFSVVTAPLLAQQTPVDPAEREKIEQVVQEYLLENPEVIALASVSPIGNPKGDVTVVEFFDYRCGYCRRHFPEVMKIVREDGNIRYIPRQYPILDREGQPPVSMLTARAALAAEKQGKFEEYAQKRIEANALAWLETAKQDVEILREAYTKASTLVINGDGETDSYAAKMTPEEFDEKITKGFESYEKDFLNKLNKHVTGEKNENLEEN